MISVIVCIGALWRTQRSVFRWKGRAELRNAIRFGYSAFLEDLPGCVNGFLGSDAHRSLYHLRQSFCASKDTAHRLHINLRSISLLLHDTTDHTVVQLCFGLVASNPREDVGLEPHRRSRYVGSNFMGSHDVETQF